MTGSDKVPGRGEAVNELRKTALSPGLGIRLGDPIGPGRRQSRYRSAVNGLARQPREHHNLNALTRFAPF